MAKSTSAHNGLLLLDKSAGCTSHDMVQQARRALRQRKIGHCGTLDPTATGLLLLTVGRSTRLTRFLIKAPKVYEGVIQLGVETDTYDAAGQVVAEQPIDAIQSSAVIAAMTEFEGVYQQVPPPYSAKKVGGRKYYELAREGAEVPAEPTEVTIFEFASIGEMSEGKLRFRLACTSGTYARSMAHDLGRQLGVGGHLCELVRTKIGDFDLSHAVSPDDLASCEQRPDRLGDAWIPFDQIPLPFSTVAMDASQEQRIGNGQTILAPDLDAGEGDWIQLVNPRGNFVAVALITEQIGSQRLSVLQPKIVFR